MSSLIVEVSKIEAVTAHQPPPCGMLRGRGPGGAEQVRPPDFSPTNTHPGALTPRPDWAITFGSRGGGGRQAPVPSSKRVQARRAGTFPSRESLNIPSRAGFYFPTRLKSLHL